MTEYAKRLTELISYAFSGFIQSEDIAFEDNLTSFQIHAQGAWLQYNIVSVESDGIVEYFVITVLFMYDKFCPFDCFI